MDAEYPSAMDIERVATIVVDRGFQIHNKLGPGLIEKVYHAILVRDLSRQRLFVESRKPVSFDYEGLWFTDVLQPDLIVERELVVELKAVPQILPIHYMQLRTYLRVMRLRHGLLMNFGEALFKNGVKRVYNER
jgi:GxxExxY protein